MKNTKKTATNPSADPIPRLHRGRTTSYSPTDVKRWGVERFLDEVCAKTPLQIPDLGFTDEENRRMDELLKSDRESSVESD